VDHGLAADLKPAPAVGVPVQQILDLRVEAAQLEGHLVKPRGRVPGDRSPSIDAGR